MESTMKSKSILLIAGAMLMVVFLFGACSSGFILGRVYNQSSKVAQITVPVVVTRVVEKNGGLLPTEVAGVTQNPTATQELPPTKTFNPKNLEELFAPFWESWEIVHQRYVDQPVDDLKLMRGAIQGMLQALGDQHTAYMDPDEYQQATIPLQQEYDGIGAWVDTDAEFLTIVSPMPGSPAEAAGLKPGDQIIAVDGEDMTGIDGNLVIRRVMGPAGSKVVLTIRREVDGEEQVFDVEVIRAHITLPSVEGKMLDNGIAYVQIHRFAEDTRLELREILKELLDQKPTGLIVDLRYNPGGYLDTAIDVTSEFIGNGVIMYEQFGDGSRETYRARRGGLATEIPLVVIVNEGSASASEIMAGAIQDTGRGILVGTKTFGKGSVQDWIALSNNAGAVRVTIARWLTPNERLIHEIGIEPDVVVPLTEDDIQAGLDPQFDKAVEVMLGMVR
jgi:carboxyl-terminal processing protease